MYFVSLSSVAFLPGKNTEIKMSPENPNMSVTGVQLREHG